MSLETFTDYFKNVYSDLDEETNTSNTILSNDNDQLNHMFSVSEVTKSIKGLKTNKSCGIDYIINEYLKSANSILAPVITNLFNLIVITGYITEKWSISIIQPIYKGKGSKSDPDNYRGISLISCLCKLFTCLLNSRLFKYLDANDLLGEEQAAFRKGYSVLDHVFALKSIIDIYLSSKKKLYICFIDYKKAFDSINRQKLWSKLLTYNINGNLLNVIKNIYNNAKTCIKKDGTSI